MPDAPLDDVLPPDEEPPLLLVPPDDPAASEGVSSELLQPLATQARAIPKPSAVRMVEEVAMMERYRAVWMVRNGASRPRCLHSYDRTLEDDFGSRAIKVLG